MAWHAPKLKQSKTPLRALLTAIPARSAACAGKDLPGMWQPQAVETLTAWQATFRVLMANYGNPP